MIDAYKGLVIVDNGEAHLMYKNLMLVGAAFPNEEVDESLHHLFQAAPVMYAHINEIATTSSQLGYMLEPVLNVMGSQEEKRLITNLIASLGLMRQMCLEAMRAAEVGPGKAFADKNNS